MTTVGFVGLGAMGSAMATRLLTLGADVVVHNRTKANAQPVLAHGAAWADSIAEVASRCSVILSCLRDTSAVEEVYLSPAGLLEMARPGTILVEHGTFSPNLARRIADEAAARSCHFLDIPVTGGPAGAQAGSLTGMAGGDPDPLETVRPIVETYAPKLLRIGSSGRGLELKLVNQLLVTTHMAAAAEASALLNHLDLPSDTSFEILTQGWAGSAMLARGMKQLSSGVVEDTGVTIEGMREVQSIIESMLQTAGIAPRVFSSAREAFDTAAGRGRGQTDPAALVEFVSPAAN